MFSLQRIIFSRQKKLESGISRQVIRTYSLFDRKHADVVFVVYRPVKEIDEMHRPSRTVNMLSPQRADAAD